MRRKQKAQIGLLTGILAVLGLWCYSAFIKKLTPKEHFLLIIEACVDEQLSPSQSAKLILNDIQDPYAYLKETIQASDSFARTRYLAIYAKLPEVVKRHLGRPHSSAERSTYTSSILTQVARIDKNIDRILEESRDGNLDVARAIEYGLDKRRPAESDIWTYERLLNELDSPHKCVRKYAFSLFQIAGQKGRAYDQSLNKFLDHPDEVIALNAAVTIYCIGGDSARTIPVLERLMNSKSGSVKLGAAYQMFFASKNHPRLVEVFMNVLQTSSAYPLESAALTYLPYCGKKAFPHLTVVQTFTNSPCQSVRVQATDAVEQISLNSGYEASIPPESIRLTPFPYALPD